METELLETMFGRMGARVKVRELTRFGERPGVDIRSDKRGEYFDIGVAFRNPAEYQVIDIRPAERHLLLMARTERGKQKFLCGHDERHWFVCAVPGASVSNVKAAMEALQPQEVRTSIRRRVKRVKNRLRRRNEAFVRQGEWFFIPAPNLTVNEKLIRKDEPISRGDGGKPHMCQYMYRTGGQPVYVCPRRPGGVSAARYHKLLLENPDAIAWNWTTRMVNASVYVRGRVSHSDHKTIVLNDWHRVVMNTEAHAPGARSVVFLD
ncbi:MAG TPA: hypothetical protein VFM63_07740 [Pyrinomonadaceae bacterium]|nr:hypothetical protein [Pyrinomonadaceae bacterium]